MEKNASEKKKISIGNGMICSDIWHKYHELYFKIVIQFWNVTSGITYKSCYYLLILLPAKVL